MDLGFLDSSRSRFQRYRIPLLLTMVGLGLYLLTTGAFIDNPDGQSAYSMSRGLLLRGSFAIPPEDRLDSLFEKPGRNDAVYSKYGFIQPILQVPLVAAGMKLAPGAEREASEAAAALFPAIITASTLPLLWAIAMLLYGSSRISLAISLTYGVATMAWQYATLTYTEPLLTALLLLSVYVLIRIAVTPVRAPLRMFVLAGTLTGLCILTKYPAVIYLPALLWYIRAIPAGGRWRWIAFLGPLVGSSMILATYNIWRYGNILNTGYHIQELIRLPRSPLYGLYVLFLSSGKSIFLYAPPLALAIMSVGRFVRQQRAVGLFIVFLAGSSALFYSTVNPWHGAWSPGPRYHLPILGLMLLPLGERFQRWSELGRWQQWVTISVICFGCITQLIMVSIPYNDVLIVVQTITANQYAWGFWFFDPDYSPLLWQARLTVSAVTRLVTGHSGLAGLDSIQSTDHPAAAVDSFNFWWIHHSGWFRLPGMLLLLMILIYGIRSLIRHLLEPEHRPSRHPRRTLVPDMGE